jgi:hypothetical protein
LSSRVFYINSANKQSGQNSNFTYEIQTEGYSRVCDLQASIPLSFYMIQDGVNVFTLREEYGGVETYIQIAIDARNYNFQTFQDRVTKLLYNSLLCIRALSINRSLVIHGH